MLENILLNVKRFNDDTNGNNYYYYQTGEMEIKKEVIKIKQAGKLKSLKLSKQEN